MSRLPLPLRRDDLPSWLHDILTLGETRTAWAEWASLIGLGVSIWVARSVWSIRRQFLRRVRLPALVSQIATANSEIARLIETFDENRPAVDTEIGKCRIYLEQVVEDRANIGVQVLASVNTALKLTLKHGAHRRLLMPSTWFTRSSTKDDVWRIYTELNVAVAGLQEASARIRIAGE
jgi:hypothetical protein